MSLRRFSRQATAVIARNGEEYNVIRRSGVSTDRYGGETYSWEPAGTVLGVLFYGSRRREIRAEDAGRVRSERASMMLPRGTDLREDDRVVVFDTEYRVDGIVKFQTHMEASLRALTS